MSIRLPIQVGLMDDDFFALKWNADLLTRDLRTTVRFETEVPATMVKELKHLDKLDIFLLDVEYYPEEPAFPELINAIRRACPQAAIICLSQYGRVESLMTAINCGTRGFLLKHEVRMGIGPALVMALQVDFLITPGVLTALQNEYEYFIPQVSKITPWIPHPGLTPQLRQIFTMRVLYGMSAPMTANEIHLAPGTVEKYMQYIYQKLSTQWGDDKYLAGLELEGLSPEVQAFHRFSLPPIENPSNLEV